MTLFLQSIWCFIHEFIDYVDSIHLVSLSVRWWFQGLQWLNFRWRFMDQQWHSVFDNSMHQPWLYFCYRFVASFVNSLTLLIAYVGCPLVFIDVFKVSEDDVFADDWWICRDITFLTIPCINHDSIFAIDFMCHSWIQWCCRFHTSVVTKYLLTISRSTVTLFSPAINGSTTT